MRETKLYKAIVQLSGHELNRLHRFIISPYFNRSEAIIRLFEWIKEERKNNNQPETQKSELWKICFGTQEVFDDRRLRKLQSDLLKLVEGFYSQEVFESNPIHKAKYLLEAIHNRNLTDLQTSTIKTAQLLSENQEFRPASYYYYKYEIEQSTYDLRRSSIERDSKLNIEEIAANLDYFYLAEKLRYYCVILNHEHFISLNYKMLFIDEIIEHLHAIDYSQIPPIVIYHCILLSIREPENRAHYDRLKALIDKHIHLFPEKEVAEILDAALNYCIIKMNSGKTEFVEEVFGLYKGWLDRGFLQVKGPNDPFHFKNIVTAGLRMSEFDWVENFIYKYSLFLEEEVRENAITFNLAQLYFYKKEYPKVIEKLSKVEYDDFTYSLNSKTLLMASYYELDEFEALDSLLAAFRNYVNRNKILTQGKGKHYLRTISFVKKLMKVKLGDEKQIESLKSEVQGTQGMVSKNWIMEKLSNLSGQI
ncbi:MAG: hypothetical protein ABIQ11_08170 [Saprospiraceae bacterium]